MRGSSDAACTTPSETFDNRAVIDMIAAGEAGQQAAGRETDALCDLSRLRARLLRHHRIARRAARYRAMEPSDAGRGQRKSVLRIDGALEPRLRRLPRSATQADRANRRSFPHRYLFRRSLRFGRAHSRGRSAHRIFANRTSPAGSADQVSF